MYFVIYNPASKSGKGEAVWKKVKKALKNQKVNFRAYRTSKERNGTVIASAILDRSTAQTINLIVLGGDGTVNEVLQAFRAEDFDRVRFIYIPTGSSNDLARAMGRSEAPEVLVKKLINSNCYRETDIGILNYDKAETLGYTRRYFIVSAGIGFDASVCAEAMESKGKDFLNKIGIGKLSYLYICLKQLIETPKTYCEMITDKGEKICMENCYFVAAMNHCYQGGGLKFCPDAVSNDGYLDICYAGGISKLRVLYTLGYLIKGKHIGKKGVANVRVKSLRLRMDTPLYVHTDGEVKTKATAVSVRVMPGKLKMVM